MKWSLENKEYELTNFIYKEFNNVFFVNRQFFNNSDNMINI